MEPIFAASPKSLMDTKLTELSEPTAAVFSDLGLSNPILKAIEEAGYTTPTPIQLQAIPPVLMGQDVLGCAQTGTGKTASFTLPMIEILAKGRARARMPRSLILTPTRELAAQVADNFEKYGKHIRLNMALLVGGVSMDEQIRKLDRGVDVLIATPGRLLDLFERGNVLLSDIKIFVIDECDRMLDMGFIPDIERLAKLLPPRRQSLLFSATLPPEIRRLADQFMVAPKEISVAPPSSPAKTVTQRLALVSARDKPEALVELVATEEVKNAFVFCNRKRDISGVKRALEKAGHKAGALHGDMAQIVRTETLQRFKDDQINLLVCSDVAARGLDIQGLSHVFNYDVPTHAEDYVHRIGRTGRAGRDGRAFTIATPAEQKYIEAIEKLIETEIQRADLGGLTLADWPSEDAEDEPRGRSRRRSSSAKPARPAPANAKEAKPKNSPKTKQKQSRKPRFEDDAPASDERGFGDDVPAFFR